MKRTSDGSNYDERNNLTTIYINCSDVAAAIGKNRFKTPESIAENILLKLAADKEKDNDEAVEDEKEEKVMTEETKVRKVEQIISNNEEISLQIEKLTKSKMNIVTLPTKNDEKISGQNLVSSTKKNKENTEDTEVVFNNENIKLVSQKIVDLLNEKTTETDKTIKEEKIEEKVDKKLQLKFAAKDVELLIERQISMKTGVLSEEKIVDSLQKDLGQVIRCRNCVMKYREIIVPIAHGTGGDRRRFKILVGGKPDGIITDNKEGLVITEVKNRQNRLFRTVPIYEMIQVQIYMWLFRASKCIFRENYHGDHWSTTIDYDPVMIETIQKDLVNFSSQLFQLKGKVESKAALAGK
jgi:hypothetical protein